VSIDIYIGIDGGGTKCKVRIEDAAGNLLGKAMGGPSQIRLSVDQAWKSILDAIDEALKSSGISLNDKNYRFHAGFALAGTEKKEAVNDFLSRSHPFTTISLKSDAYAACLGAHGGKDGAIIIIGTGVAAMRIQGDDLIQVSGWGFPHGDEGGGAYLGSEAVRLTFHAYDGRVDFSPLLQAIMEKFNNDIWPLVSWACEAKSTQFAEIAPLIIEHVDKKDPWALQLIKQAAHEIDRIYMAMEKRAQDKTKKLPYSLFGGVTSFIEPWLSEELRSRIVPRQADAAVGAIYMVKK
jgi:glucosamine kinase